MRFWPVGLFHQSIVSVVSRPMVSPATCLLPKLPPWTVAPAETLTRPGRTEVVDQLPGRISRTRYDPDERLPNL